MIAAAISAEREALQMRAGQLVVYVTEESVDDSAIASVKHAHPGAVVLAELLEPLYDASIPTRQAAYTLGRVKSELESMVQQGMRVVVLCSRRHRDLGTRSHFLASLCASADRVHFLKST
jgi:hypothetical protein